MSSEFEKVSKNFVRDRGESSVKIQELKTMIRKESTKNSHYYLENMQVILEALEKDGIKLLSDYDSAMFIYAAAWNDGLGSVKIKDALNKSINSKNYLVTFDGQIGRFNAMTNRIRVSGFTRGLESFQSSEIAELIKPILDVQEDILSGVGVLPYVSLGSAFDSLTIDVMMNKQGYSFNSEENLTLTEALENFKQYQKDTVKSLEHGWMF